MIEIYSCNFCGKPSDFFIDNKRINLDNKTKEFYTVGDKHKIFCSKICFDEYKELYNAGKLIIRKVKPFIENYQSRKRKRNFERLHPHCRRRYSGELEIVAYNTGNLSYKERVDYLKSSVRELIKATDKHLGHSKRLEILERRFCWKANCSSRVFSTTIENKEGGVLRSKKSRNPNKYRAKGKSKILPR